MTALEIKIIEAVKARAAQMDEFDASCQKNADNYRTKAKETTDDYWRKDYEHQAEWALSLQHHGYDFIDEWRNIIGHAMYGKKYREWHSAQAGRYKGTGHDSYVTSDCTAEERENIVKVWNGMVKRGYFKISKSGAKARLVKTA